MKLAPHTSSKALLVLALLLAPLVTAQTCMAETPFRVTTVFLVRHAEKQTTPPGDPPLTSAGKARARSLVRILRQVEVKAILTSQFIRTRETARPLAEAIGVASTVISIESNPADPNTVTEQSIKDFVDRILQHAGDSVLVVGHTNTIPQIIARLGGDRTPNIPETEFDNLFIVTVYEQGKARVIQLKY